MFTALLNLILDIVFPHYCTLCERPDTVLCDRCIDALPVQPKTLSHPTEHLSSVTICADYRDEKMQKLITAFKFNGIRDLAVPFGIVLSRALLTQDLPRQTTIIPIPLHRSRERSRGFNQSALLAQVVADSAGFPLSFDLERIRARRPQHTLNRAERLNNLRGVFRYRKAAAPATVLLIDDIATTSSTLNEAAKELKKHGSTAVHALVIAKNEP